MPTVIPGIVSGVSWTCCGCGKVHPIGHAGMICP